MSLLIGNTVGAVIANRNEPARMLLAELRREATMEKGHDSPKMFVVKKRVGEENLHKLLCFIVKVFQDSLKITNPANEMSPSEIFQAADMLMGTAPDEYGYESVFDILAAFKQFKASPFEIYNAFSDKELRKIMTNYLTAKADFLERLNGQAKREDSQKPPLTLEQIQREYELSQAGLPTNGDRINEAKRQREAEQQKQSLKEPRNWHKDRTYQQFRHNWQASQDIEDVPHEVIDDQSTEQP